MIFITCGSFVGFDELMKKVDELVSEGIIKESVIAQIGNGKYAPKNFKWFRYAPTLAPYFKKADLVISHEGAGTIFELATLGKKSIIITNPKSVDNPDLVMKMSQNKHVLWCKTLNQLEKYVTLSKKFKFVRYKPPVCNIPKLIERYLSS
ncbi:MAG: glycosyltransferase [Candidatus Aenigmarchaeota archaeon]|nr:glycosyltransferase [Candidatus Aenigmarchaeota archaeon]